MLSLLRKLPSPVSSKEPELCWTVTTVILAFNERVLDWAVRDDVPLLERLRYLCIVSSNLDEFFEVRAEPHLSAYQANERKGLFSVGSFEQLSASLHAMVERQYTLYNEKLMPAFEHLGIKIVSHGER
jgi:polyphosphate kinase